MDGSCHHAREQAAPAFDVTAEQSLFNWAEVIHATEVERRFVALHSEVGQSCHRRLLGFSFPAFAQHAPLHDFSYNLPATRYPIQFSNLVERAVGRRMSEFLVKIRDQESGYPYVAGKDDRIFRIQCYASMF